MTDTTKLHDLLRSVAEDGGDPDEDSAWAAITTSIAADRRRSLRRTFAIGSALALGAAAAALVVVTAPSESPQTLDVGPADAPVTDPSVPDTSSPDPGTSPEPSSQVGTPVTLPADPAVVIGPEGAALHVMDAATGERVSTPLTSLPEDERISDATITASGEIYLSVRIPEATVLARTAWDGDGYEVLEFDSPILGEGGGYSEVAVSSDGTMLAFSVSDVGPDTYETAIGLLDLRTSSYRQLDWPDGDQRASYHQPQGLSFSADGTRLAFSNVHDTDGTDGFDAFVVDVSATSLAEAEMVVEGRAWDVTFDPAGGLVALVGDTTDDHELVRLPAGSVLPSLDAVTAVTSSVRSVIARTETSWFRLDSASGSWVEVAFSEWTG